MLADVRLLLWLRVRHARWAAERAMHLAGAGVDAGTRSERVYRLYVLAIVLCVSRGHVGGAAGCRGGAVRARRSGRVRHGRAGGVDGAVRGDGGPGSAGAAHVPFEVLASRRCLPCGQPAGRTGVGGPGRLLPGARHRPGGRPGRLPAGGGAVQRGRVGGQPFPGGLGGGRRRHGGHRGGLAAGRRAAGVLCQPQEGGGRCRAGAGGRGGGRRGRAVASAAGRSARRRVLRGGGRGLRGAAGSHRRGVGDVGAVRRHDGGFARKRLVCGLGQGSARCRRSARTPSGTTVAAASSPHGGCGSACRTAKGLPRWWRAPPWRRCAGTTGCRPCWCRARWWCRSACWR